MARVYKTLLTACVALLGHAALAGQGAHLELPSDVRMFTERRDSCDHFRGEEPYDEARKQFLMENVMQYCTGTDRELAVLKQRYKNDPAVMRVLSRYEVSLAQWHTTPHTWKAPRTFHSAFDHTYNDRIAISHEPWSDHFSLKVFSPNKAYWYGVNPDDVHELLSSQSGASFHVFTPDVPIYVFNERNRLIKIVLKDHYPNFVLDVRWINEKLLYIEVWWGRVLGSYIVFDVEREAAVYKEMVNDGGIPFMQWQERKQ